MRYIILIFFLVCSYFAQSQGQPAALPTIFGGKYYKYTQYLEADSGFLSPLRDTNFVALRAGMQVFRNADTTLYISTGAFSGLKWKAYGNGGSGSGGGIYNSGYGLLGTSTFKVDSSLITTRLRTQKLIDSLSKVMGLQQVTNNGSITTKKLYVGGIYSVTANSTDFTSRVNVASQNTVATPIRMVLSNPSGDSIVHNIRGISPVTGAGYSEYSHDLPLVGGYLAKSVDGVAANSVGNVVGIKTDTASLSNRINLKLNISDTATMLSNYKKKTYVTVTVKDANYTVVPLDDVIFLDTATATRVLLLPSPSTSNGRQLVVTYTGTAFKWTLTDSVIDITGNDINFIAYNQSITLVSNGIYWVAVNNSNDVSGLWTRVGNVISPVNVTDSLSGLLNISYGGEMGGWITINTGVATTFSVNGNYRFIDFPTGSINTGLVLSSTTQGQMFRIRNGTSGSLTISPSYINSSNASIGTISANSVITLVYDGSNYKQF